LHNIFAERLIVSIRRECLEDDTSLSWTLNILRRILKNYSYYYVKRRENARSLNKVRLSLDRFKRSGVINPRANWADFNHRQDVRI